MFTNVGHEGRETQEINVAVSCYLLNERVRCLCKRRHVRAEQKRWVKHTNITGIMLWQDERHTERGKECRRRATSRRTYKNGTRQAAGELRLKTERPSATYEDPSELDMDTRLVAHTSCERLKAVVVVPERLRRAPPPPSARDTRAVAQSRTPAQHTFITRRKAHYTTSLDVIIPLRNIAFILVNRALSI